MQSGSIKQHGRFWVLKYREWVTQDGKKIRKDCYRKLAPIDRDHQPKKDGSAPDSVRVLANVELAPVNAGTRSPLSADTVQSFLETFLAKGQGGRGRQLNHITVKSYWDMYKIAKPFLPNLEMRQVRTPHIDQLLQAVSEDDGEDRRAQTTYRNLKNFLSSAFRYAVRHGLVDFNPVRDAAIPEGNAADTHAYSLQEIRQILNATENLTLRAAYMVAAFTGLRMEELKGLKWEDFDGQTFDIKRVVVGGKVEERTKTQTSKAKVPVVGIVKKALAEHLARNSGDGFIFHSEGDSQVPIRFENSIRRHALPIYEKKQLPWHGMHAFRRGLATALHELNDVRDLTIKHIMRHSINSEDVTAKHYIKPDLKLMREALEKVEKRYKATR